VDEIPRFKSEADEARICSTHSLAQSWDQLEPVAIKGAAEPRRITLRRVPKKPVTLRLETQQIARAKALARTKRLSYQALLRSGISEDIGRVERLRGHP
jgi:predicted DNA binding CopG/RHH family protein